ncbi:MAG: DmsE family decaheme c-type cytochrome [Acidobacteria bacterium]|nr:DmsE family decaheme c-type cytochrome [Acidobacteriota bacterium]
MREHTDRTGRRAAGGFPRPPAGRLCVRLASLLSRISLLSIALILILAGPLFAQQTEPAAQQSSQAPQKVGTETCMACHDMEPVFSRTAHARQECENCHGPGSAHVEAGGDSSLSLTARPARAVISQCLSCHGQNSEISAFHKSAHGRNNTACVACHQVHPERPNFGLLRAEQKDLCVTCHPGVRADFRKPFHHPVMEGAIRCSDCHTPHSEDRRPLRRLALATDEGCVSCHSDKKGPFVFEHAAVKINGCESCHQPHGSVNTKMLRRTEVQQLCLECHSLTPGVAGGQPPAFHDLRTPRFRNCTTCHREIHGSNSSPVFFR